MARYRTTFNPATGEHIQYLVTGLESDGAVVRYRWTSDPGGTIVDHTHPGSTEIFTILEGTCDFTIGGKSITLGPGETGIVPPGVVHSEANRRGVLVRGIVELQPAAKTAKLHDALAGIGSDLPHKPNGAPKSLLQLGATFWYFRDDIRATAPPIWLQNLFLPILSGLAKARGVLPERPEWDSRLPDYRPEAVLRSQLGSVHEVSPEVPRHGRPRPGSRRLLGDVHIHGRRIHGCVRDASRRHHVGGRGDQPLHHA